FVVLPISGVVETQIRKRDHAAPLPAGVDRCDRIGDRDRQDPCPPLRLWIRPEASVVRAPVCAGPGGSGSKRTELIFRSSGDRSGWLRRCPRLGVRIAGGHRETNRTG